MAEWSRKKIGPCPIQKERASRSSALSVIRSKDAFGRSSNRKASLDRQMREQAQRFLVGWIISDRPGSDASNVQKPS